MPDKSIRISSTAGDGIQKLERSKLQRRVELNDDGGSSIKSIIMLVIIIVLIAITGAYVIKNLQPTNNNTAEEPTPVPSPTPMDTAGVMIGRSVEQDLFDDYKVENKTYTDEDTTLEGNEAAEFEVDRFVAQPYESFYRIEIDFEKAELEESQELLNPELVTDPAEQVTTGTGAETEETDTESEETDAQATVYNDIPHTVINYRNRDTGSEQIQVTFSNMFVEDSETVNRMDTYPITNSSLEQINYNPMISENGELSIVFELADYVGYHVQVDENKIVLDIEEAETRTNEEEPTPAVSPEEEDPSVSVTPGASPSVAVSPTPAASPTPAPTGVPTTSETFTMNVQPQNVTANTKARISGYTFDDTTDAFLYQLKLAGDQIPRISSRLNANNTLEVKIEELSFDGLTKDGKAFTDFTTKGVKDVLTMDVSFGGTTSTYVYTLSGKKNYDIYIEEVDGENRIFIEISH